MSWRDSISQTASAATIADIQQYVLPASALVESPIDAFYNASRELLKVGTPSFVAANASMGSLLMVGLVSITENYFRDVFSQIIRLCPLARSKCADQTIHLGSVLWHGGANAERGAFEHMSFASSKNLKSTSERFLDYKLRATSVLDQFDSVCELRHGIVHASAVLAGKNAVRLGIAPTSGTLRIAVGFGQLQECAAICTSLVVSINQELFVEMARRWVKEWPKAPGWNASKRHAQFKAVWTTFHSNLDEMNGAIQAPMSTIRCKNRVAADPFTV